MGGGGLMFGRGEVLKPNPLGLGHGLSPLGVSHDGDPVSDRVDCFDCFDCCMLSTALVRC